MIGEQISAMTAAWPGFKLMAHKGQVAAWQGRVRPLLQWYAVEIWYRAPHMGEALDVRRLQPRVSVVDPPLRPRKRNPEGKLPHVYYDLAGNPTLCLFDPDAGEWSPFDLIAETTVPWTIEWLAAYEGWRATGKWTASGRHVDAPVLPDA